MNVIRVIFHVSDADKWPVALANVQNLLHAASDASSDVHLLANSLKGHGISQDEVPEWMTIVPVGVLTLIDRQSQGFAYIKP